MNDIAAQDGRGFFMLPQGYEGGGYYIYGTPDKGQSQYAHPKLISIIAMIAASWVACDIRKFGVGNISLADGIKHPDHSTHRSGLEVDIRPLRKDGLRLGCNIYHPQYDQNGTEKLITLFLKSHYVKDILFNDRDISGVQLASRHDDHFHVSIAME